MRLLLDTHVWLWLLSDPAKVPGDVRKRVEEAQDLLLSAASLWELTIKVALGRLPLPSSAEDLLRVSQREAGVGVLDVGAGHALAVGQLPPHHGDPFDRMLVAQARVEDLVLVTADEALRRYDVPVLWAR